MSYTHKLVTVTSSGIQALSTAAPSTDGLISLRIQVSSGTVYLGSSAVTTSGQGFTLTTAHAPVEIDLGIGENPVYAATSTSAGVQILWRRY